MARCRRETSISFGIMKTLITILFLLLARNDTVDAMTGKPGRWRSHGSFLTPTGSNRQGGGGRRRRRRFARPFLSPKLRLSAVSKFGRDAWNKTRTASHDLLAGATEVHNSFLELKWTSFWNGILCVVSTVALFSFLNVCLGDTWTKGYRVGLMKVLFYSRWICRLPSRLAIGPPLFLFRRLDSPLHVYLLKPPTLLSPGHDDSTTTSRQLPNRSQILVSFTCAAIDEVAFRWSSYRLWNRISLFKSRKSKTNVTDPSTGASHVQHSRDDAEDGSETEIKDQRKWVLLTSLVYGIAKADVSLFQTSDQQVEEILAKTAESFVPDGDPDDVAVRRGVALGKAMLQFTLHHGSLIDFVSETLCGYVFASTILAPIFLARGLMASIGAQILWKAPLTHLQVKLRLLCLGIRKIFGN